MHINWTNKNGHFVSGFMVDEKLHKNKWEIAFQGHRLEGALFAQWLRTLKSWFYLCSLLMCWSFEHVCINALLFCVRQQHDKDKHIIALQFQNFRICQLIINTNSWLYISKLLQCTQLWMSMYWTWGMSDGKWYTITPLARIFHPYPVDDFPKNNSWGNRQVIEAVCLSAPPPPPNQIHRKWAPDTSKITRYDCRCIFKF